MKIDNTQEIIDGMMRDFAYCETMFIFTDCYDSMKESEAIMYCFEKFGVDHHSIPESYYTEAIDNVVKDGYVEREELVETAAELAKSTKRSPFTRSVIQFVKDNYNE